jgi:hypothetical protein
MENGKLVMHRHNHLIDHLAKLKVKPIAFGPNTKM